MWWEPDSSHEEILKEDVGRLVRWYSEGRDESQGAVWGVGSAWSPWVDQMVPMVTMFPMIRYPAYGDHIIWGKRRWRRHAIPFGYLHMRAPVETGLPLHVMLAFPPKPSNIGLEAARAIIRDYIHVKEAIGSEGDPKIGSAGVMVKMADGQYSLLTAGHVLPGGVGSVVEKVRWPVFRRFSPRCRYGIVSHHCVPTAGTADWDVAIVAPDVPLTPRRTIFTRCVRKLTRPERIFARGAISGFVSNAAALQGALVLGRGGGYAWKNCWIVAPTGVLGPGDSGSAVFLSRDGSLLGIYVGAEDLPDHRPLWHYVQDAWSLETNQLRRWNSGFA